MIGNK